MGGIPWSCLQQADKQVDGVGGQRKGPVSPAEGVIGEVSDIAARIITEARWQLRTYTDRGQLDAARQFLDALTSGLDDAYLELSKAIEG